MGVVMLWRHDPTASPGLVYALAPITLALAGLTVVLLRSYATGPHSLSGNPGTGGPTISVRTTSDSIL